MRPASGLVEKNDSHGVVVTDHLKQASENRETFSPQRVGPPTWKITDVEADMDLLPRTIGEPKARGKSRKARRR